VETTLEGSAQPIPGVSGAVVTAVNHAEGAPGDESRYAAHMLLSEGGPSNRCLGTTGVVDNVSHISHKSKGLKRCSCGLAFAQLRAA
jgi:hypothetical protein